MVVTKDTEKTRVEPSSCELSCFAFVCLETRRSWVSFRTAGSRKGEDWLQAGMRAVRHDTDSPGLCGLGPEVQLWTLGIVHAGQGSEGPAAGGDPKQNTDCAFANRIFQTTVSTASQPGLLSAGVVGLL